MEIQFLFCEETRGCRADEGSKFNLLEARARCPAKATIVTLGGQGRGRRGCEDGGARLVLVEVPLHTSSQSPVSGQVSRHGSTVSLPRKTGSNASQSHLEETAEQAAWFYPVQASFCHFNGDCYSRGNLRQVSRYSAVAGKASKGSTSQTKQNSNNHDNKDNRMRGDTRIDLLV